MRRLRKERLVRLVELAGRPVDVCGVVYRPALETLIRWHTEGKGGVQLDAFRCPVQGVWFSSHAAVARFEAALEAATVPGGDS